MKPPVNAIIGNGRILASMLETGAITSLTYPNLDYAQNVGEIGIAIYYGEPTKGWLTWLGDEGWTREQRYLDKTNIVETNLFHTVTKVSVEAITYVLPDADILVQCIRLMNQGEWHLRGRLFYYAQLNMGEFKDKNTVIYDNVLNAMVQWSRQSWVAVGGDNKPDTYECGKLNDPIYAKDDLVDGDLKGYSEILGQVDIALGWDLDVPVNGEATFNIFSSWASERKRAVEGLIHIRKVGEPFARKKTREFWQGWLDNETKKLSDLQLDLYQRSLLALRLLFAEENGSFIAGATDYNYAYCWPRDGAEAAYSFLKVGCVEITRRYMDFCLLTQEEDGSWFHRYWITGEKAPSWCALQKSNQYDQTASVVWLMAELIKLVREEDRQAYLDKIWGSAKAAASFLYQHIDERTGLHQPCTDLWEERIGVFTYTAASFYAGLLGAASLARLKDEPDLASRWEEGASRIKSAVLERLVSNEGCCLNRGLGDPMPDASVLAAIDPFRLLDLRNTKERVLAEQCLDQILKSLGHKSKVCDGFGISRYSGDRYVGEENPWVICTLWAARAQSRLAESYLTDFDVSSAEKRMSAAKTLLDWCWTHTTSTGLLPEQVDAATEKPAWVIPLGWSLASYIYTRLLYQELGAKSADVRRLGKVLLYKDKLEPSTYSVLCTIHIGGRMTASQVAKQAEISYSQVGKILYDLTRQGLIEVTPGGTKLYSSRV